MTKLRYSCKAAMAYKIIILDFDGTLVESVGIKDRAFHEMFKTYPDKLEEIMRYHLENNATIRYDKFRYIFNEILKEDYTEEKEMELCGTYSGLVVDSIIKCQAVQGSTKFLECFSGEIPFYLVSVNPLPELEDILKARGMKNYFTKIYAHPWIKKNAIKDLMGIEGIGQNEILFIGDTYEDFNSARETGVTFIGRDSGKFNGETGFPVYENFNEIMDILKTGKGINEDLGVAPQ